MRRAAGLVHLVGAGPGDPGLLTVRAAELIRRADAVVYDRLVHPKIVALASEGARLLYVGKEGGKAHVEQADICRLLVDQARLGREVVRLKGGDPFVFGRGGEEALALRAAGVAFDVVPGVSSGFAAPAAAGIPVTHRGLAASVTFATGRRRRGDPDWSHLARAETLVLFMGCQRLAEVTGALVAAGRSGQTPAAMIESGTWQDQRVVAGTLADLARRVSREGLGRTSLLVVGEVVRLREEIGDLLAGLLPLVPPGRRGRARAVIGSRARPAPARLRQLETETGGAQSADGLPACTEAETA